jgi:hypothetical protein
MREAGQTERTIRMLLAQVCELRPPGLAIVGVVAIVLVALLIWGSIKPLVWRLLAVIGMGNGVGLLVWGIIMAATGEEPPVGSSAGIIGTGAGVLVSAIVLLVISFLGGRPRTE